MHGAHQSTQSVEKVFILPGQQVAVYFFYLNTTFKENTQTTSLKVGWLKMWSTTTACFCVRGPAMGEVGLRSSCLHKQSRLCGKAAVKQTAKQQQTFAVLSANMVAKDIMERNKMKERWEIQINHFAWFYLRIVLFFYTLSCAYLGSVVICCLLSPEY